ncbi:D-alanyl-D-alanine carboxypeptidase family protein [Streptomyces sp. NPDC006487]|uniref:D-alanyl-D-alanine carboxypeptidase family protein n=1 Tax=Streptomyces sp. NPDC006487 TaxID=3364748 RepID=UPI003681C291
MRREPCLPSPADRRAPWRRALPALPALTAVLCTAALALGLVLFARPPAAPALVRTLPGAPVAPGWPATGQGAFAVAGGQVYASPHQAPVPMASTAKLMTAYVFLSRYPLPAGGAGPSFTVSAAEAGRAAARAARSESVVPLEPGQRVTERQALEALLGASANNVADELARWYGPAVAGFVGEMNGTAQRLGMAGTHYTGPSGLEPSTVSTAADQVRLLRAALRLPAFTALASSSYTDVLGHRHVNTNPLLGREGVFAGKTGTTRAAGRNLVFAARREIDGRSRLVVGAVLGQPRPSALTTAARQVMADGDRSLVTAPVVRAGEALARVRDPRGRGVALRAEKDLTVTGPPGAEVALGIEPETALSAGTPAGTTAARVAVTGIRLPGATSGAGDTGASGDVGGSGGTGTAGAGATRGAGDAGRASGAAGGDGTRAEVTGSRAGVALVTGAVLPRGPATIELVLRPWAWAAGVVTG